MRGCEGGSCESGGRECVGCEGGGCEGGGCNGGETRGGSGGTDGGGDILVRPMTAEDIPGIWRLEQTCFSDPWSVELLAEALANDYDYFWVAEMAACPVGDAAILVDADVPAGASSGMCTDSRAGAGSRMCTDSQAAAGCRMSPGTGQVVAYANLRLLAGEGEIERIAVNPAMRRRGIGRKLMEAMVTFASQEGVTDATLEVRAGNIAARKLYESFGFVEEGRRKAYYRNPTEDALIMWRRGGTRGGTH